MFKHITAIEWGLICALISIAAITALPLFGVFGLVQ